MYFWYLLSSAYCNKNWHIVAVFGFCIVLAFPLIFPIKAMSGVEQYRVDTNLCKLVFSGGKKSTNSVQIRSSHEFSNNWIINGTNSRHKMAMSDLATLAGAVVVDGNLFFKSFETGDTMIIKKNEDDTPIENKVISRSNVMTDPREVYTIVGYIRPNVNATRVSTSDGSLIPVHFGDYFSGDKLKVTGELRKAALDQFLEKLSAKFSLDQLVMLDFIHSHPYFEFIEGEQKVSYPLNRDDLDAAKDDSKSLNIPISITAVVPNGYRYSSIFFRSKNITEHVSR